MPTILRIGPVNATQQQVVKWGHTLDKQIKVMLKIKLSKFKIYHLAHKDQSHL